MQAGEFEEASQRSHPAGDSPFAVHVFFTGIRIGKVFLVLIDVLKGQVFQEVQRDVSYLQVFAGRIALQDISEKGMQVICI